MHAITVATVGQFSKWSVRRLLLAFFVLSLFFPAWSIVTIGGRGIQITFFALGLAYLLAVIESIGFGQRFLIRKSHVLIWCLLLVATGLVYRANFVPFNESSQDAFDKALRQLFYLYVGAGVYFIVEYLVRTKRDIQLTVQMFFVGGWLALIYGLAESASYFGIMPWFSQIDRVVRGNPSFFSSPTEVLFGTIPRLHSFAPEQSFLGFLLLPPLALSISATLVKSTKSDLWRPILVLGLVLLYLLTFSRLSVVIFLVVFAVEFFALVQLKNRSLLGFAAMFLALGLVFVPAILLSSIERAPAIMLSPWGTDLSVYTRTVEQIIALQVWSENFFGTGWGLYGFYFPVYVGSYLAQNTSELWSMAFANPQSWVPINNTYLRLATELGIEGVLLFLVLLGMVTWQCLKSVKETVRDPQFFITLGILASILAIIAGSFLTEFMAFPLLWFLLALGERIRSILAIKG